MKTSKLTDTQLVLLNNAAQRENGSAFPLPEAITAKPPQVKKAIAALLNRTLFVEQHVSIPAEAWREENGERFGLIITDEGRAALGIILNPTPGASPHQPAGGAAHQREAAEAGSGRGANRARLVEMLSRPEGASIDEITAATAWLPHSARAMLTGLRKLGFTISSEKLDGVRRYRGTAPEASQ